MTAKSVCGALGCTAVIPPPSPYFPFTFPSLYPSLGVMAGLAAATCDANFRRNGCVAISPGASPPVLQRRPARHKHIRLVLVCWGNQYLPSGLGLLTLTLLAPEITVSWHTLTSLRRNAPTADPGRNLLLPKCSWVASNGAVSRMLRVTSNGELT